MPECTGHKISYPTRAAAKADAREVKRIGGRQLRPYKCPYDDNGEHWHLTSQSASESKRRERDRERARGLR
jgi:hypothetical protein